MPEPKTQPSRYLFFSHNSHDKREVKQLAEQLEAHPLAQQHKLKVWLDKNNLQQGKPCTSQFAKAINDPQTCAFLLFMPRTDIRGYVNYEIDVALNRHLNAQNDNVLFPILPISSGRGGVDAGRLGIYFHVERGND